MNIEMFGYFYKNYSEREANTRQALSQIWSSEILNLVEFVHLLVTCLLLSRAKD